MTPFFRVLLPLGVMTLVLSPSVARADGASLVVVQSDATLQPDAMRIEGELRLAGFAVRRERVQANAPTAELADLEAGVAAIVRLRGDADGVQLWLADAITDKVTMRSVERGPDVALRVVELLHASLLEIRAGHFAARRSGSAQDTPPALSEATEAFVEARMAPRASPRSRSELGLGAGLWLDGDYRPALAGAVTLLHSRRRLVVAGDLRSSITPRIHRDARGETRVSMGLALLGVGGELSLGDVRIAALVAAGVAVVGARSEASERYRALSGATVTAYLEGQLRLRVLRPFGSLGLSLTGGSLLPAVPLTVENEGDLSDVRGPRLAASAFVSLRLGG